MLPPGLSMPNLYFSFFEPGSPAREASMIVCPAFSAGLSEAKPPLFPRLFAKGFRTTPQEHKLKEKSAVYKYLQAPLPCL